MLKRITVKLSGFPIVVFLYLKARFIYSVLDDAVRNVFKRKPVLYYLELDIAEHCNLNCKGCQHFCQLVESDIFTDLNSFQQNMNRLSELFHNIKTIRLLGGEPLLHKDLAQFIYASRNAFPRARIYLVTNGLLLFSMPAILIESIKENNVKIQVSLYEPMFTQVEKMRSYLTSLNIDFSIGSQIKAFGLNLNLRGDSDAKKIASRCRAAKCQYLSANGHISRCSMPYLIKHFNAYFSQTIPSGGNDSINIHNENINGFYIKNRLNKPMKICSYCTDYRTIPWEQQVGEVQLHDICAKQ